MNCDKIKALYAIIANVLYNAQLCVIMYDITDIIANSAT